MIMSFRVKGLDPAPFLPIFALSEADLAARGAERVCVSEKPGAPCRITLDDAEIGETVMLLSHAHQPHATPYHQHGPIFVREAKKRFDGIDVIPPALARRMLSLRGFDANHMMIEADLVDGSEAHALITRFLANPAVSYIHAHYARRGCFAALVERV
jgi:hypothetical protein